MLDDIYNRQVKQLTARILFRNDLVSVIEEIETLRERERVLGRCCGFKRRNGLGRDLVETRNSENELPDVVGFVEKTVERCFGQVPREILNSKSSRRSQRSFSGCFRRGPSRIEDKVLSRHRSSALP